jgi:hypothetical protein
VELWRVRGGELKQRMIATRIWYDERIRECTWLEKWIFIHFQLREEMTNIGACTVTKESVEVLLNHVKGRKRNRVTPAYPWILLKDINAAIRALEKTGSIITQNSGGLTVYFPKFLDHNKWAKSVFTQFPELIKDRVPEGPIVEKIKRTTVEWMEKHRVVVPEVWR